MKNVTIPEAINALKDSFEDKSEGSYYYGWQSNIAMAFVDAFHKKYGKNVADVHEVANEAAKNFLNQLIN